MRLTALFVSLVCLAINSNSAIAYGATLQGKLFVDGQERATVAADAALLWKFNFFDSNGDKATEFKTGHGKKMHLLVIKDDLSEFVHVHPTLVGKTGDFIMVANQESADPDNYFAKKMTPSAGRYHVIGEIFPDRGQLTPVPEAYFFEIEATAKETVEPKLIVSDKQTPQGTVVKYFKVEGKAENWWQRNNPKLVPGAYGDQYEVTFRENTVQGCGGNMVEFHIGIRVYDKSNEEYAPIKGLQNWLQMTGHAVLLSTAEPNASDKLFAHLHAMAHGTHQHLVFSYFDRKQLNGRQFKLWAQAKHDDFILTFPFVFDYTANYTESCLPGETGHGGGGAGTPPGDHHH